jgi:hypothetical protein
MWVTSYLLPERAHPGVDFNCYGGRVGILVNFFLFLWIAMGSSRLILGRAETDPSDRIHTRSLAWHVHPYRYRGVLAAHLGGCREPGTAPSLPDEMVLNFIGVSYDERCVVHADVIGMDDDKPVRVAAALAFEECGQSY